MKAEITYTAGRSYRVKGTRFERGKTKVVTDSALVKKCQQTVGFNVRVIEPDKKVRRKAKKAKTVVKPVPTKSKKSTGSKEG